MRLEALIAAIALSVSIQAQWTSIQPMLAGRYDHGAATGPDGKVYVAGGRQQTGCSKTMEQYDPLTNTWTPMPSMTYARCNPAVVMGVDGYIYVIGGFNPVPLDLVERYDTRLKSWQIVAPLSKPRAQFAAAVGPDLRLYVLGGITTGLIDSVEVFDGTTWTLLAPKVTRTYIGMTGADGNIYTFPNDVGDMWGRFDGVMWSPQGTMTPADPQANFTGTYASDGLMYLLGVGTYVAGVGSRQVVGYGPFGLTNTLPDITPRVRAGAAAAAEGRLFITGGRDGTSNALKSGESFGPLPTPLPLNAKAWFRFDGNVSDSAGSANAVAVGSPKLPSGRVMNALHLNGSNQFVSVASGAGVNFSGEMTIEGWIRWQPGNANINKVTTLIDKRTQSGKKYQGYSVFLYKGRLGVQLANGTTFVNYGGSIPIDQNQWTHIAVTRSGALLSIYVNSVLDKTWLPLGGSLSNPAPLFIGRHSFSNVVYGGDIDELTFYDRALRWAEVRAIFLAGREGKK